MRRAQRATSLAALVILCATQGALAQSTPLRPQDWFDTKTAIAVADSVLVALSIGDSTTLRRLTLDSAIVGGAGERGTRLRTWGHYINRQSSTFVERGFDPTAMVQDRLAMVWMPYDLYVGKTWSHCGIDVFTLAKTPAGWRVAALVYTIEQPPACRKHPGGPPTS